MEPDSFKHYGVKGMKWGVRRSQAQLDAAAKRRSDKNEKKATKKNRKKAQRQVSQQNSPAAKNQEAKSLSDNELRQRINRLQMERQYTQLTSSPQTKTGARKVGDILLREGGQVVANAGKQVATQLIKREIEKAVGLK